MNSHRDFELESLGEPSNFQVVASEPQQMPVTFWFCMFVLKGLIGLSADLSLFPQ